MKFADYDKDEREEWLKQSITTAYLEALLSCAEEARAEALTALGGDDIHSAKIWTGRYMGLGFAGRIAAEGGK